jgi:hypothetical protein
MAPRGRSILRGKRLGGEIRPIDLESWAIFRYKPAVRLVLRAIGDGRAKGLAAP